MATAADRSRAARKAVNASWSRTANWAERTAPARRNSPISYGYWLKQVTEEGEVRPKDRAKVAEKRWREYQSELSAKAVAARRAKAAQKTRKPAA